MIHSQFLISDEEIILKLDHEKKAWATRLDRTEHYINLYTSLVKNILLNVG